MLFDDELLPFDDDNNDELDQELTTFINTHQQQLNNKHSKHIEKQPYYNKNKQHDYNNPNNNKKTQLPRQFHKAKRTLSKIVHDYFIQLKKQYQRMLHSLSQQHPHKDNYNNQKDKLKKINISFYLRKDQISSIIESISKYVGITYKYQNIMDLKFNYLQQLNKKVYFESRKGSFAYLPECQKIINLNLKGKINEIKINSLINKFKIPDFATPIPYKDSIYFLDSANFDKKTKTYTIDKNTYKISDKCQISIIQSKRIKDRIKCAIVRDDNYIYLIGGSIGVNKIVTSSCERFCPKKLQFEEIPSLRFKHRCPSACIVKNAIWVFSKMGIEVLEKGIEEWQGVEVPWNMKNLPFQFVAPYSQSEIVIFGGVETGQRSRSVQVYNCLHNWVDVVYGILPQSINSQRVWGPSFTDMGMAVLSPVLGQNQPDLKQKNHLIQSLYFTINGIFLNSITTTK